MQRKKESYSPIAIIGMACRFPGGAVDLNSFWQNLVDGQDAIVEVPQDRWDINQYYDSKLETPGKMYTRWGGFLRDGVRGLDASFFDLRPLEAQAMDPQQRLGLEVVWEALENSYLVPTRLRGTDTGVFFGAYSHDYSDLWNKNVDQINPLTTIGTSTGAIAGRISHFFGLRGPSMVIDTASSASLVAIHMACESLWSGRCGMAIAGGVNLILNPERTIGFCKAQTMAKDGRCKTFSENADGYVRSEGCGVLILKPLVDALRDQDGVWAVIRGSAINQDGYTEGLMAPNTGAQAELYTAALHSAGVAPADVSYVEAHGTGTPVGDAAEANSLGTVYSRQRATNNPLFLGSVKTNLGHLESAAGVAGVIKTVLMLKSKFIPKNLHCQRVSPRLGLFQIPAIIPLDGIPWQSFGNRTRLAAVSSFGMSGTNAHIILEEFEQASVGNRGSGPLVLFLSAKTEQGLKELKSKYETFLTEVDAENLWNICRLSQVGRECFPKQLVARGSNLQELMMSLSNAKISDRGEEQSVTFSTNEVLNKKVLLPNYPFQRQIFWIDESATIVEAPAHSNAKFRIMNKPGLESRAEEKAFRDLPERKQTDFIKRMIVDEVRDLLGIESDQSLDDQKPFKAQGLDSLMMVELRNRLKARVGDDVDLSTTVALDYPTVDSLADHMQTKIGVPENGADGEVDKLSNLLALVHDEDELDEIIEDALSEWERTG